MKKIYIVGLGYIGLPLACILSQKKKIICIDTDKKKIEDLKNKKLPFKEKNLKNLFYKNYSNLIFYDKYIASKEKKVFIICVPTPLKNGKANLKFLNSALKEIFKILNKNDLIIIESTIPPGTTKKLYYENNLHKKKIHLAYCPERAIPGNTIYEMKNNYRVIGGINNKSSSLARKIYSLFSKRIILTDSLNAEISKLSENTYRLVNIALANEINELCNSHNINSKQLFKIANLHPRVNYLKPGIGVGGHCIPIDPVFLNENNNIKSISSSILVNKKTTEKIVKKILSQIHYRKKEKILCLGITYKDNVDDTRESPAIKIINKLKKHIKHVSVYDPINKSLNNIDRIKIKKKKFDLVIYLVNHSKFKELKIKSKNILDYRH